MAQLAGQVHEMEIRRAQNARQKSENYVRSRIYESARAVRPGGRDYLPEIFADVSYAGTGRGRGRLCRTGGERG